MLAIPNTTTTTLYTDPAVAAFPSDERGALTPYVQGFLFVANNPAFVSVLRGRGQGATEWTPDTLVQPTMVPLTTDRGGRAQPDYIWGVRARSAVAGAPAQVFGALFQAGEAAFTPGAQFTGTVAPSGGFTPPAAGGGMQLIQDQIAAVPQGFTFSSIPATFKDLLLVVSGRSTLAAVADTIALRFNGDGGANYDNELGVFDTAGPPAATAQFATNQIPVMICPGTGAAANFASAGSILIPDYANTVFFKSAVIPAYAPYNVAVASRASLHGGNWRNTAAVNSIALFTGLNFVVGSRATLYGLS